MSSHFKTPPSPVPSAGVALPRDYGVTRLVLLPRDPRWMHVYWEVAPYTWDEARRSFGEELRRGRAVVRLHNHQQGSARTFDIEVHLDARNWYINAPGSTGPWHAELGLILPDGRFVLLAVSNTISMPSGQVSDVIDEKWGILSAEWDRLFELSGGGRLGAGSFDMAKMLARRWELLQSLSSWPGGVSSFSSWARPAGAKGFWLIADCEVIVYGATEPDARVTFQGKPISLNPDGTFSFRLSFPDGAKDLPISAVNKDGDITKSVKFTLQRKTDKKDS